MLCIQKGAISPKTLHIATSDISQGKKWCCVFKKVQYHLTLCILLHPIYHKDKNGVVYSKRCKTPMSLHMCIQKDAISPKSLHIAASDISQGQKAKTGVVYSKKVQYRADGQGGRG